MKRNTISTAGQAPVEPKSDRLCHALAHAANGFRVFPLKPNGKTPLVKAWQKIATTDEGQIRAWWKQWPDANIAIATGDWLLVVDADCKNDQPGLQSLIMLQVEYEIPGDNYEVNTPTGGKHVYLEIENDPRIRNSAGSIEEYPGIDIRCNGGYVVAAGSVLDAGEYTQNDQPVNRCPSGIADIARRSCGRPGNAASTNQPITELDTERARDRATEWLRDNAQSAVEGSGGDDTTYRVSARVRDFGISERLCLELMSDNWNDDQHPPWPIDDLAVKVANAYNFATGAWGGMSADAEFDRVEVEDIGDSAKGPPDMDTLKHFSDLAAMGLKGAGEYLIKGLLYLDTLCVMYGRSGEYKTFVALDWAFHIAAGLPWNGRKVKQGLVVYVATEGGGGFPKRIAALAAHYGLKECPFVVDIRSIDLASRDNDAQDLLAKIRQAEAHYGCPVRLIVIDTLARAMAGGDENSARDMGSLVKVAEQVQRATKAAFMFIHHQGKDQSKGARGSTALVRAIDTEIEISDGEIRVKKQRDVDEIRPIKFKFKQILLGKDEEGDNVTSGVIELVSASEFAKDDLKPTEALFVEAHNAVARRNAIAAGTPEDWPNAPVMREEWVAEYQKSVRKRGRTQGLSRSRISSLVQTVQASGHILKTTENQYVSL